MSTPHSSTSRRLVVVTVLLGTCTVSLNNSALNPAVPEFMSAFGIGPVTAGWIITGFMISMGMTMPVTGFLSHKFGKKLLYLFGLALFIAGSCTGALSTAMPWVIAARCIQGVAGGLMIPLSLALIFEVYPKDRRGRVTGLWGTAVMLAPAVGPAVGGVLLQFFEWPVLFLMNIPVGLLAWLTGVYCLPARSDTQARRFDWRGFVLVTLGVGMLLAALSRLPNESGPLEAGSIDPENIFLIAAALLCLAVFVRVELNKPQPLLNLRIFAIRSYGLSVIVAVAQSVGMFGCILLLPLLMQKVLGHGPVWTGLALLATAVFAAAFVNLGGAILDARGPRHIVTTGLIISALSTMAFGLVGEHSPLGLIFFLMTARGIGLGLSYMPVTTAGLNAIPESLVAQGSAMNNISRRVVSSIAVVLVSLYIEIRSGQLIDGGVASTAGNLAAINECFVAIGLLILLAVPAALLLPSPSQYARLQHGDGRLSLDSPSTVNRIS